MGKKLLLIAVCGACVCALTLPALAAPKAPAGDAKIFVPKGYTLTKAAVPLNHEKHKAIECKDCHHTWDGKAAEVGKCGQDGCHANTAAENKTGKDSYYMAFHAPASKHSCVGCHKAAKAAGGASGPVVCNKCHPGAQ